MSLDVFISHSSDDAAVALAICRSLEAQNLTCWIAPRDILPGTEYAVALADAIPRCRATVLLLSRSANESPFVHREIERAVSRSKPILTVRIAAVEPAQSLELFISSSQWFDAFDREPAEYLPELGQKIRLLLGEPPKAPEPAPAPAGLRVALLYKRRAQPDERLLALLESHLTAAGHRVFIDRHMTIGVEWAKQIAEEIRQADAVVVLLSAASIYSEMLAYEVEVAHQAAQENAGKPRLLPVRIDFEGSLPQELSGRLDPLHYFLWRNAEDDPKLVAEILDGVANPPRIPPTLQGRLEMVGGAVPLDSKMYVIRPSDGEFQTAIERQDATVLVKGARQMGKTSLLARGLQVARNSSMRVALTDFQRLSNEQMTSPESLYLALSEMLAEQLDLDLLPQDVWRAGSSPNFNFERYVKAILKGGESHLLWAMDEVDRLFTCAFGGEVFALFRTWHNARATHPDGPWPRLTLAIAYATEAHLFISDPNQSPFNVGTRIALSDFTLDQVADLNRRHGSPLHDGAELTRFFRLLGGHPYLTRRGLSQIVTQGLGIDEFAASADQDDGPFGDHLRRILVLLARDPALCDAVRGVLQGRPCADYDTFYRLRSGGVLVGASREEGALRCEIYASYLRRQLL